MNRPEIKTPPGEAGGAERHGNTIPRMELSPDGCGIEIMNVPLDVLVDYCLENLAPSTKAAIEAVPVGAELDLEKILRIALAKRARRDPVAAYYGYLRKKGGRGWLNIWIGLDYLGFRGKPTLNPCDKECVCALFLARLLAHYRGWEAPLYKVEVRS